VAEDGHLRLDMRQIVNAQTRRPVLEC
jgi:hypothetical protein